MASTSSPFGSPKRPQSSAGDVQGFVHSMTDIKIPANNKGSRYFEFQLQESEGETRVVCFDSVQRDEIKEKELNKRPVRLINVSPQKRRYCEGMEYKMNKYSRVSEAKSLSFAWKAPETLGFSSVKDILEKKENGELVNVYAKVVSKSSSEKVYSRFMQKELAKCDIVIADSTGAIGATMWEAQIPELDEALPALEDTVVRKVLAADVSKMYICLNCRGRIPDAPGSMLKCSSCFLTMKRVNLVCITTANVLIREEPEGQEGKLLGRFFCSSNVLQSLFTSLSKAVGYNIADPDISSLESDMIIETLVNIEKLLFVVVLEDKVVKALSI